MKIELSISLVVFEPDIPLLERTLVSLYSSIKKAGLVDKSYLYLIDNSSIVDKKIYEISTLNLIKHEVVFGHGNVGFGRAHNTVLSKPMGRYHLILNPDVEIDQAAIANAIVFLNHNIDCGLLTPYARYPSGERQYLCKRYPAIVDFFLRGTRLPSYFNIGRNRLTCYEMRLETNNKVYWNPLIVSGCFMLYRSEIFRSIKGFDPRFFLYFEDFDISLRTHAHSHVAYVPQVKIIHSGGNSSKKGWWHIEKFTISAFKFYCKHGLKLI